MHFAAVTSPPQLPPRAMRRRGSFDAASQSVANAAVALLPPVDVNTAEEEALCTLAGVTKAKAQTILAYREAPPGCIPRPVTPNPCLPTRSTRPHSEACGGFSHPEQLLAIPQLGASLMKKNLPRIVCSPVPTGHFRGGNPATGGRLSPGSAAAQVPLYMPPQPAWFAPPSGDPFATMPAKARAPRTATDSRIRHPDNLHRGGSCCAPSSGTARRFTSASPSRPVSHCTAHPFRHPAALTPSLACVVCRPACR